MAEPKLWRAIIEYNKTDPVDRKWILGHFPLDMNVPTFLAEMETKGKRDLPDHHATKIVIDQVEKRVDVTTSIEVLD